ncbi:MAG: helix-turn-helix domain-containing protein [Brevundimonas sp.]
MSVAQSGVTSHHPVFERFSPMSGVPPDLPRDGELLSAAVKAVRKHRGMTTAEVANAMNMALRTYERFESGATRLNLDHIHRFAAATNSDPYALILSVVIGSPELARRCADNKMATILTVAIQRFDRTIQDRLLDLDARTLISAVTGMFDTLLDGNETSEQAQEWLQSGAAELLATRPKPGR